MKSFASLACFAALAHTAAAQSYEPAQLTAWQDFFANFGHERFSGNTDRPNWAACRGTGSDPCKCDKATAKVTCEVENDTYKVLSMVFEDNQLTTESGTFDVDTVNSLLSALPDLTTLTITGDTAGLGDAASNPDCLQVLRCMGDSAPVTCDFSPRTICVETSAPTMAPVTTETGAPTMAPVTTETGAPTMAPVTTETGAPTMAPVTTETGAPTMAPVTTETGAPTMAPIALDDNAAWTQLFTALTSFLPPNPDKNDTPDINKCRGTKEDACKCFDPAKFNAEPFEDISLGECVDGEIVRVDFRDNGFDNEGVFPVAEANEFLKLNSITEFNIIGDADGLGGADQGCLRLPACMGANPRVACNVTPRTICDTDAPTATPTKAPTMVKVTDAPTMAPTMLEVVDAPTMAPTMLEVTDAPTMAPTKEEDGVGAPTMAPTMEEDVVGAPTMAPTTSDSTDSPRTGTPAPTSEDGTSAAMPRYISLYVNEIAALAVVVLAMM